MARTLKDAKLDTRAARQRFQKRREPHWRSLSEGMAVGYRKGAKGGTWIARHYSKDHGRRYQALGTSDDVVDADGLHVLNFNQAQEAAREWYQLLARKDAGEVLDDAGPYTVAQAMADYVVDYKRRGGKAVDRMEHTINAHILPKLGDIEVARLTKRLVREWRDALVDAPARVRTRRGEPQRYKEGENTPVEARRRRSSVNRVFNIFKAGLNYAHQNDRVTNNVAWTRVKLFRNVDAPRVRYLTDNESKRLVNVSPPDLRLIVTAALLTGGRYGEIAALTVNDFDPDTDTIYIAPSKSGKDRHVVLTQEGVDFFKRATAGQAGDELIFRRSNGTPWKPHYQSAPMREACAQAKISPPIGFHILRHTYASRFVMGGAPVAVVAKQLGNTVQICEKHYAHLAKSYVADTLKVAFGDMGLVEDDNVETLA